jgi:hypothetical protein
VNVYVVPLVSPVALIGELAPVNVAPPGDAVTRYPVIADPPLVAGALNETTENPFDPLVALTPVGAPGGLAPAPPIIIVLIDIKLILHH